MAEVSNCCHRVGDTQLSRTSLSYDFPLLALKSLAKTCSSMTVYLCANLIHDVPRLM